MNVTIAQRVKTGATLVGSAILIFVLFVSRDHITHTARMIGLDGYQAETLFILIDIVALLGKVLTMKYFARGTRRLGTKLTIAAGLLSLACNVAAGQNFGQRAYGVFIIALFITLEQVVLRIKPAASVTAAQTRATNKAAAVQPAPAAPVARTAKKCAAGCTCGKHNAIRTPKAPAAAKLDEIDQIEALFDIAPVSPAPAGR